MEHRFFHQLCGMVICLAGFMALNSAAGAEGSPEMKMQPFALNQVRLLDSRWKAEMERNREYLHALDNDRLLYAFRKQAGLEAPGEPYGGWEAPACEVRGHFVGHYLSACALMYASTGDESLKEKANALIGELSKCQQAMGGEYLCAFPESFWERLETGQSVWVPYYTVHKIMAGLYDMHTLCGNAQALDIMKRMAAYFKKRLDKLPNDAMDRMLRVEFGGMSEVLHNLYSLTGDPVHLEMAHRFDQPEFLGPLALSYDNLTRIHGNTQIPKIVGAARRYELMGDTRYRDLSQFFWDCVVNTRTYATGGSTMFESWPEPNHLANTLGNLNHETCKTFNMLRLTRHLLCWTAGPKYGDFYERALFNGILGTQGPQPGQLQYYVAMASGYPRTYGTPDNSFWCCYGTGVESFSKLGDSIYFQGPHALYVNLFIPSTLDWKEEGVRMEQTTMFPDEEVVRFKLGMDPSKSFSIHIRIPYWATQGVEAKINGETISTDAVTPSSWLTLERAWKNNDIIEIRLPMSLHAMPLPDDPNMTAVLYGPVVLAGVLEEPANKEPVIEAANDAIAMYQKSFPPLCIEGNPQKPAEWIVPVEGQPLTFTVPGQPLIKRLVPFANIMNDRYGLYWPVAEKGSPRLAEFQQAEERWTRELDRVLLYTNDANHKCSERLHNIKGKDASCGAIPSTSIIYRHCSPGGWFEWTLKSLPDAPVSLLCTYWGSDVGRTFDVLVNGELLKTESLNNLNPGKLVDVEYSIPAKLTKGKDTLTVTFKANHDTMGGGVFGIATLQGDTP